MMTRETICAEFNKKADELVGGEYIAFCAFEHGKEYIRLDGKFHMDDLLALANLFNQFQTRIRNET